MTYVKQLDTPRRDPTANKAVRQADRDAVRAASKAAEMFVHEVSRNSIYAVLMRGDEVISTTKLPEYGETLIVTHDAKVKHVKKTTSEKVE